MLVYIHRFSGLHKHVGYILNVPASFMQLVCVLGKIKMGRISVWESTKG